VLLVVAMVSFNGSSQPGERKFTRTEYIDRWKVEAVKQMNLHGIPASITLAQGILESGYGNSALAKYANNHFGIKCHNWKGLTFIQDDDKKNECFRKYQSAEESFRDHSLFLANRDRYAFLFKYKSTDYNAWAKGLKKAGYATNPKYPDLLIKIIERNNLHQYDKIKKIPHHKGEEVKRKEEVYVRVPRSFKIHENNIKYVVTKKGDNVRKLAIELELGEWQICKYNDIKKTDKLKPGQVIFIQPKRNKGQKDWHVVKRGETLKLISQQYGVKLKMLYKYNGKDSSDSVSAGERVALRKK